MIINDLRERYRVSKLNDSQSKEDQGFRGIKCFILIGVKISLRGDVLKITVL